ncbi:MAG: hypothetical protein ACYC2G_16715, partial [Gemmatimonadaceae bacterium]
LAEVQLRGSIGDERVDGLVGAVAAQLDLGEPGPSAADGGATAPVTLRAGYRCADDGGVLTTLERR